MAVARSPLAVELDLGPDVIPHLLEAATCFIVLESLANVAKHAQATNVRVKVWVEDQRLVTEVEDDGVGGATGLGKLKERARTAGGTVEIDSPPGVGTLIRAEVPFAADAPRSNAFHCDHAGPRAQRLTGYPRPRREIAGP